MQYLGNSNEMCAVGDVVEIDSAWPFPFCRPWVSTYDIARLFQMGLKVEGQDYETGSLEVN